MGNEFLAATRKLPKTWVVQQFARHKWRMEKFSIQGDREVIMWWMIKFHLNGKIGLRDYTFYGKSVNYTICEWPL